MTEKRIMKLASRGKRFGAACIDSFIPVISYLLYSAVMIANGIGTGYPGYGYGNGFGYGYEFGYGYGGGLTPLLDSEGKPIVTKDGYQK
jgi:hypothetical protein